jgi:hypothetical protein
MKNDQQFQEQTRKKERKEAVISLTQVFPSTPSSPKYNPHL